MGVFFFQAEDGIRDLVRSRGLGDVYKRQHLHGAVHHDGFVQLDHRADWRSGGDQAVARPGRLDCHVTVSYTHLTLPTSDLV